MLLAEAGASARALRESLAEHPDLLYAGYSQDALKEYAEAALVYAFLHGDPPPDAARWELMRRHISTDWLRRRRNCAAPFSTACAQRNRPQR